MKIVIPGRNPEDKRFECPNCGCYFIADKSEYQTFYSSAMSENHKPLWQYFKRACPTCGQTCITIESARSEKR